MSAVKFPICDAEKWTFIRNYFDTYGSITTSGHNTPHALIKCGDEQLMSEIVSYCKIPCHTAEMTIMFDGVNAIDFLGHIYNDQDRMLQESKLVKSFAALLSPNGLSQCNIYKADEAAIMPSKTRESDVGYDLTVIKKVKDLNDTVALYDTGIRIGLEHGTYAEVVPRSSLSKSGYMLANSIGIIDPSYLGNIYIALAKISASAPEITFPFRCCQLVFKQHVFVNMNEVNKDSDLGQSNRGSGGFGSTGIDQKFK